MDLINTLIVSIYLVISIILIVYNHTYIRRKESSIGRDKEAVTTLKQHLTGSNIVIILGNIDSREVMSIVNYLKRFVKEISRKNETPGLEGKVRSSL